MGPCVLLEKFLYYIVCCTLTLKQQRSNKFFLVALLRICGDIQDVHNQMWSLCIPPEARCFLDILCEIFPHSHNTENTTFHRWDKAHTICFSNPTLWFSKHHLCMSMHLYEGIITESIIIPSCKRYFFSTFINASIHVYAYYSFPAIKWLLTEWYHMHSCSPYM